MTRRRTPLIISGPVEHSENKIYVEVKPLVINLRSKQSAVVRSLLKEARERSGRTEMRANKTIETLLQIKRGDPKNPVFLDIVAQNQATQESRSTALESMLSAQKMLPGLDQILYCTIDERSNSVELTEKGIKLLSDGGHRRVLPCPTWMRKATDPGRRVP